MNKRTITTVNGQSGFTLIEVIAVLVIVGMLAAVAIPKYLDMQTAAANNAVQGALAAGSSNVTMLYSNQLLQGTYVDNTALVGVLNGAPYTNVGDFTLSYATSGANGVVVTVASSAVASIQSHLADAGVVLTKTVTYAN